MTVHPARRRAPLLALTLALGACGEPGGVVEQVGPARSDVAQRSTTTSPTPAGRAETDAVASTDVPSAGGVDGDGAEEEITGPTYEPPAESADSALDVSAFDTVNFVTPSGLTRCQLTVEGAVCDLPEGFAADARPTFDPCYEEGSVPAGVRVGRFASWRCSEGLVISGSFPGAGTEWINRAGWGVAALDSGDVAQLPFGSSLTHTGTTCTAQPDSMVCKGPEGAGFRMNTTGVTFIVSGDPVTLSAVGLGDARFGDSPESIIEDLRAVLGEPEDAGYREGCPLAGTGMRGWSATWGSFSVYGENLAPGEVEVSSWTLGMGTTSAPIDLPGGLTMDATAEQVLASDPAARREGTYWGEPGDVVVAHDLDFIFDGGGHLTAVQSAPLFCE